MPGLDLSCCWIMNFVWKFRSFKFCALLLIFSFSFSSFSTSFNVEFAPYKCTTSPSMFEFFGQFFFIAIKASILLNKMSAHEFYSSSNLRSKHVHSRISWRTKCATIQMYQVSRQRKHLIFHETGLERTWPSWILLNVPNLNLRVTMFFHGSHGEQKMWNESNYQLMQRESIFLQNGTGENMTVSVLDSECTLYRYWVCIL